MTTRPLIHVVHGLLMGAADSVPGVSGGTVALAVGIYERLLASIGAAFKSGIMLIRGDVEGFRTRLGEVEWRMVVPLLAGIATALVVAAAGIETFLERFPSQSRALFLGMVAASITIPLRRILHRSSRQILPGLAAAVIAYVLTGLPPGTVEDPSLVQVFLAAAVAICAMILPGVSGAFLLLVLGMYTPTIAAVNDRNLLYVLVFMAGAAVGLGTFSLLLTAALTRHHDLTMAVLVGLMIGSLRALWPWQDASRSLEAPPSAATGMAALGIAFVGLVIVLAVERWGSRAALR
ncbi:MAG: DUF368 domain-containing protein [Acidimicrobiia bacterium]|nr:DUF368 domain-containing protein [Acidimicrobiia bacterium]MDH4306887.1 DUF368 domain-containing protein [Acidimicrobiia bacterium]MDH5293057.1 DUF368 domain-containing protein [Acidimicrobiia bacterium]